MSVIVAMRNSSATLPRLAESLKLQTLRNAEYVVIDDCSSDNSVETISRLMPEARIIRLDRHSGTSLAKGLGMKESKGEYIIFVDSDDYIEADMLADMYDAAKKSDADIVCTPYYEEKGKLIKKISYAKYPASLNEMPIDTLHFALCNKLIRRSMIEDNGLYPFEEIDCWEDLGVMARLMTFNPKIIYLDRAYYHYVQNSSSITHGKKEKILSDHIMMAVKLTEWLGRRGLSEKYAEFINYLKFIAKVKFMRNPGRDIESWKNTFPEVNPLIMKFRYVPIYYRLLFKTVLHTPSVLNRILDKI